MMMNCWKLSEYRNRLNADSPEERMWLDELEHEYREIIQSDITKTYSNKSNSIIPDASIITEFLNGNKSLSNDEIVGYMNQRAISLAESNLI
jgi:hypothetical protein